MAASDEMAELKIQMVDLQTQLAFQEDTIQALNDVVASQQQQIDKLGQYGELLKNQLDHIANEMEAGGQSAADERPPHY